jgi:alkylation response protein AidB-like acyl-CoA dehydrogenase
MAADGLLTAILVLVIVLLVVAVLAGAGVRAVLLRWRRTRGGLSLRRRPGRAAAAAPAVAAAGSPATGAPRPAAVVATAPVEHGDVAADDPRILELGLEEPTSTDAVFRNLQRIKPLLRQEAAESDRMRRTTPLAGGALRATGLFRWGFPVDRGGLGATYADRLEAVSQIARIDAGMAWVVTWLTAHGDLAGRLDDASFAEIYPTIDLPTTFSATPFGRAVEIDGDRYRIEPFTWRLGSGGYHADRWIGGVKVVDGSGQPVLDAAGEQRTLGVWLPADAVQQAHDWDPLGVRSSGSSSFSIAEPVEIPRGWSFDLGANTQPYFFSLMGVLVGATEHLIDLTLESLRKKRNAGTPLNTHDLTQLTSCMSSLDMLVFGLRGYTDYLDRARSERASRDITPAEAAWVESVGLPVRETVIKIRDVTADIYGTGYVASSSEFGRVLRDLHVGLAHGWLRVSNPMANHGARVEMTLNDPPIAAIWDTDRPERMERVST